MNAANDKGVLAVMDRCVEILHHNAWGEDREDLEEARTAVAELVEAAKEMQAAMEAFYANDGDNGSTILLSAAFHKQAAALARVQGGEA